MPAYEEELRMMEEDDVIDLEYCFEDDEEDEYAEFYEDFDDD